MKKHLIAAAVAAAVAAPAMAQVTVYGNLDLGYSSLSLGEANDAAKAKTTGLTASRYSSSRLGFRVGEDLGGGLKAFLTQEFAVLGGVSGASYATGTAAADKAGPLSSNRTSIVGLSGSFGSVSLGRNKTQNQLIAEGYDASEAVNAVGNMFLTDGSNSYGTVSFSADDSLVKGFTGDRQDGMLMYSSPKFAGFQVHVDYASNANTDEDGTASENGATKYQALRADYSIGDLSMSVGTATEKVRSADASAFTKDSSNIFGAKYNLGATTVFFQYGEAESTGTNGVQTKKLEAMNIGVAHKMGNVRVFGQVGTAEVEGATAGTKTHDKDSYGVGATYSLSKRTAVYALYGSMTKKAVSSTDDTAKELAFGINHKF